jgi:hypothetical protein
MLSYRDLLHQHRSHLTRHLVHDEHPDVSSCVYFHCSWRTWCSAILLPCMLSLSCRLEVLRYSHARWLLAAIFPYAIHIRSNHH